MSVSTKSIVILNGQKILKFNPNRFVVSYHLRELGEGRSLLENTAVNEMSFVAVCPSDPKNIIPPGIKTLRLD